MLRKEIELCIKRLGMGDRHPASRLFICDHLLYLGVPRHRGDDHEASRGDNNTVACKFDLSTTILFSHLLFLICPAGHEREAPLKNGIIISTPFSTSCPASLQLGGLSMAKLVPNPSRPIFQYFVNADTHYADSDRPTSMSILCVGLKLLLRRNSTPSETFQLVAKVCTLANKFLLKQNSTLSEVLLYEPDHHEQMSI